MSSVPRAAPSSVNRTPATATLSAAFTCKVTIPEIVDACVGAVIEIVGGTLSQLCVKAGRLDVVPQALPSVHVRVCEALVQADQFEQDQFSVQLCAVWVAPMERAAAGEFGKSEKFPLAALTNSGSPSIDPASSGVAVDFQAVNEEANGVNDADPAREWNKLLFPLYLEKFHPSYQNVSRPSYEKILLVQVSVAFN